MKQGRDKKPKDPPHPNAVKDGYGTGGTPTRFTEEERRRLADFFILLDRLDRVKARGERKAA